MSTRRPLPALRPAAAAVLAAASLWTATACAFEIEKSETRYADRRYQCDLSVKLDASPDKVEAILRDYAGRPTPVTECRNRPRWCATARHGWVVVLRTSGPRRATVEA